jgi:uncharacterized protein YgiM (DUF1202 family)
LTSATGNADASDQLGTSLSTLGFPDIAQILHSKAADFRSGSTGRDMFVVAPDGLNVRSQPSTSSMLLGLVPFGKTVRVSSVLDSGWAQIASLTSTNVGYVCNTCAEGGVGGPWLVDVPPGIPTTQANAAAIGMMMRSPRG